MGAEAWRWNGWGSPRITLSLPAAARALLVSRLGPLLPPRDAPIEPVLAAVPPAALPDHPLIRTDAAVRLRHARGQSLPDWVALRSGRIGRFPDGVAFPTSGEGVRDLLQYAARVGARVIPYGGGTSVAGHINPLPGERPVLTLSLARLAALEHLDEESGLATFGAGVRGPRLEAALQAHGYTLGHFPQSFDYSTLGGWVATRSSGQQSRRYGRIEDLFAGGRLEGPRATLEIAPHPASAAGPRLRELILGSEGRLGVLTEVTVRVRALPERESFHGIFFPTWEAGLDAVREMARARLGLSMIRLSTPEETVISLAGSHHPTQTAWLERFLRLRGAGASRVLAIIGLTGSRAESRRLRAEAGRIAGGRQGVSLGSLVGQQWARSRFRSAYLRHTLWQMGVAVDTVETATTWANLPALKEAVEGALRGALDPDGERVVVFSHLSHLYPSGSSLYTTILFRLDHDPEVTLARWQRLKEAASLATIRAGGTISHQHGVGTDHAPYLTEEIGAAGVAALRAAVRSLDPDGMMNPGKLLPPTLPGGS